MTITFSLAAGVGGAEKDPRSAYVAKNKPFGFRKGGLKKIDASQLRQLIREKEEKGETQNLKIVDLRHESAFQKGAVPFAVNIPLNKLSFELEKRFTAEDPIIFYGYSKKDKASANSVILSAQKGYFNTALMEGGWAEWEQN